MIMDVSNAVTNCDRIVFVGKGYFSPLSTTYGETRIMIEGDVHESAKSVITSIFSSDKLEEISLSDTSIIKNQIRNAVSLATAGSDNAIKAESSDGVCNILTYPPGKGKGSIAIKTNDYVCLGIDQYLNDVIIEFYLQYLLNEVLTPSQRAKTHVFGTFFYNTLTNTNLGANNAKLTAPQKRHERVKNWTKHVNIFEKDFVIVPINQQSHWFLAIICYPSQSGPESNQPAKETPVEKKSAERKESVALQIGNTTITPVSKKDTDAIYRIEDDDSERDEAEGDDSDLESNDSESETSEPQPPATQTIKQ